ncbi:MAG: DegT/DnrJ/EryC1/StrS family aminotransferase [Candidatus Binatia bacterium]
MAGDGTTVLAGGTPVLVDVEVDAQPQPRRRPGGRRRHAGTRAVLPVHFAGQPCDLDALAAAAPAARLVEDARTPSALLTAA